VLEAFVETHAADHMLFVPSGSHHRQGNVRPPVFDLKPTATGFYVIDFNKATTHCPTTRRGNVRIHRRRTA